MPSPVWIYTLSDRDGRPRYVGQSIRPSLRLIEHLRDDKASAKSKWIAGVMSQGRAPKLRLLQCVPKADANNAERRWIKRLLKRFPDLCNVVHGNAAPVLSGSTIRARSLAQVEAEELCALGEAVLVELLAEDGLDANGDHFFEVENEVRWRFAATGRTA